MAVLLQSSFSAINTLFFHFILAWTSSSRVVELSLAFSVFHGVVQGTNERQLVAAFITLLQQYFSRKEQNSTTTVEMLLLLDLRSNSSKACFFLLRSLKKLDRCVVVIIVLCVSGCTITGQIVIGNFGKILSLKHFIARHLMVIKVNYFPTFDFICTEEQSNRAHIFYICKLLSSDIICSYGFNNVPPNLGYTC